MQDHDDGLKQKISDWLQEQGYPLELEVAREFRRHGFTITHSEYYSDPDTNTEREIDLVATKQIISAGILIRIGFVVECKLSKEKPWILFTSTESRVSHIAKIAQTPGSICGSYLLNELSKNKDCQAMPIFEIGLRPAFGVTNAFTTGKDVPYEAMVNVSKATSSLIKEHDLSANRQGIICSILFPIIITKTRLFEAFLDTEMSVQELQSGALLSRQNLTANPHTIVKISSYSSFCATLLEYSRNIDHILNLCVNGNALAEVKGSMTRAGYSYNSWR